MKNLFTVLITLFSLSGIKAMTVYDPANHATAQAAYIQDTIQNAKEIAEMVKQYQQLVKEFNLQKQQFSVQQIIETTEKQIRDYAGDPTKKKGRLDLNLFDDLVIVKTAEEIKDLSYELTESSIELYERINHSTGEVEKPTDNFKKHKVTEKTYNEYERTTKAITPELKKLETELQKQLEITKTAETEIEVQRATAAVMGLKAKIDILLYKERLANNQLNAQSIRNKNKEGERRLASRKRVELANKKFSENTSNPEIYKIGASSSDNEEEDYSSDIEFDF